jgi:hypothetical protein
VSITELSAERRARRPYQRPNRAFPADYEVVTRRINRRSASLTKVIGSLPDEVGPLQFDEPFLPTGDTNCPRWQTTARLYGAGHRLRSYVRVEVEVAAWSNVASELRLRPVTRRVPTWGRRRQRRYFRLAHRGADEIVRSLDAAVRRRETTLLIEHAPVVDLRPADAIWPSIRVADLI